MKHVYLLLKRLLFCNVLGALMLSTLACADPLSLEVAAVEAIDDASGAITVRVRAKSEAAQQLQQPRATVEVEARPR
jgi:hypothetical protein